MMTHPLLIASNLPIKTLVARQLSTNCNVHVPVFVVYILWSITIRSCVLYYIVHNVWMNYSCWWKGNGRSWESCYVISSTSRDSLMEWSRCFIWWCHLSLTSSMCTSWIYSTSLDPRYIFAVHASTHSHVSPMHHISRGQCSSLQCVYMHLEN